MTEEKKPPSPPADTEELGGLAGDPEADQDAGDSQDSDAIRALLKRSTDVGLSAAATPDLLRGVQRKLRQRSKGKFYADGWSTTQSSVNYAVVAFMMLIVLALAYFALGPTGISAH